MFRWWHFVCRVLVPLLFLTFVVSLVLLQYAVAQVMAVAAFSVLFVLGIVGGVMGLFLSRGTLRMACPFCGVRGKVLVVPGGLGMECATCGLVRETGLFKLRLVRQAATQPQSRGQHRIS